MDHDEPGHVNLKTFNELWKGQLAGDSMLVFSTGRSPHLFHRLAVSGGLRRRSLRGVVLLQAGRGDAPLLVEHAA